jgi:hypothetical protein
MYMLGLSTFRFKRCSPDPAAGRVEGTGTNVEYSTTMRRGTAQRSEQRHAVEVNHAGWSLSSSLGNISTPGSTLGTYSMHLVRGV